MDHQRFIYKCQGCRRVLENVAELSTHRAVCDKLPNIMNSTREQLKTHYNKVLNVDKSTYKSSNDEPTPIECIEEMMAKLPDELWTRSNLKILDPCCGNGNYAVPVYYKLLEKGLSQQNILENALHFNDINEDRLYNVRTTFCNRVHRLNISKQDFLAPLWIENSGQYDLIMANPPYAKLMEDGTRASKNHNLIKDFIEASLRLLKPDGYLMFISPDNWMSYADRNVLIEKLTSLQIIHLDIHSAKKHFKKVGSSFTWYIIQNRPAHKNMTVSGIWKGAAFSGSVISKPRRYIPLLYNDVVESILAKTVDNDALPKFQVKTSSDLHRYTKRDLISNTQTETHIHRLIHTPSQTVYANRAHKFQEGYKVFLSVTDKYAIFVDNCGMTQSIVFILCESREQAEQYKKILEHPLYVFINNICRWGNFNNIRVLQHFPTCPIVSNTMTESVIYKYFNITEQEQKYIREHL
jgi:methylase of polypeptide subunit release factors